MFVASFSSTLFANFLLPSSSSILLVPTGPYWSLLSNLSFLYLCCCLSLTAADAIDENYGVAVVFHEDEGEEGGRTETAVAQDEENEEVRGGERGRRRGGGEEDKRALGVHSFPLMLSCLFLPSC